LTGRQGGGLTIGGNVYLVGHTIAAYAMNSTTGFTAFDGDADATLTYGDIQGLHGWKKPTGGYYSPNEVRVAGVNSVWVSSLAVSLRYVSGSCYRVVGDSAWLYITATTGMTGSDLDGNSITPTNSPYSQNMTIDASDVYVKGSSDGYNKGYRDGYNDGSGYGNVYFDYDYDDEGSWTGYCRARCTRCGSTSWYHVG